MHLIMSSHVFCVDTKSCVAIGTPPVPSLLMSSTTDLLLPPMNSFPSYCFSIRKTSICRHEHINKMKSRIKRSTLLRSVGSGNQAISCRRFKYGFSFHGYSVNKRLLLLLTDFIWLVYFSFQKTISITYQCTKVVADQLLQHIEELWVQQ